MARNHGVPIAKAGRQRAERRGNVDEFVSGLLNLPHETMAECLSPEQIDANAASEDAHLRERGLLFADKTGTGKGRALAGMADAWLRRSDAPRVLYLTAHKALTADIWRDIVAIRQDPIVGEPLALGRNMPENGDRWAILGDEERKELMDSGE